MLALGIDLGTSGVRSAVVDGAGAPVAQARAPHPAQPDPDRIDAALWWTAVAACLDAQVAALARAGHDPAAITAIAVDGTSGSMVLTDQDLRPVSRALMYNSKGFDTEAAQIARHAPSVHIAQGSNSALGRAMRLASEAGPGARHLLHQADFIAAKLIGWGGASDVNNALKTGVDPATGAWPAWVAQVIDPTLLPQAHGIGDDLGPIDQRVARRFGLSPGARVRAGTTDSIAAFLASAPALDPGVAVTSLGSTLAIKMLSPEPVNDPTLGLYAHRLRDLWLVGGASNTGGAVLAAHFSVDDIARLSDRIDPDLPTGLDYYPLIQPGERFPVNDPTLPPRLTPRPADDATFLQGLFEGIAAIEARAYQAVAARGGPTPTVLLSAGGGATNPVFTRIRARALGMMPVTPTQTEAAIGTAKLAAGLV
ncbi:MAG: FGGY-family carbohydrate kinase [Pseudomonadota bacterium]